MYNGYKIVAVTPAGRKRFLKLLCHYTFKNSKILDKHELWVNTKNQDDINYINDLCNSNSFFKQINPTKPVSLRPAESIYQFFNTCIQEDTIYIRFDDDICFICDDTIEKLVKFRIENPDPFLVYPIIICNGMEWVLEPFKPVDKWIKGNDSALEHIRRHVEFLSDPCSNRYKCEPYIIPYDMNISVNCICWMGKDFKTFNGIVPPWPVNEETWLSNTKPFEIKRPNMITGDGVVVHFSYSHGHTMTFLEKHTNLYQRYLNLSKSNDILLF